jgi:hypothetical protein
MLGRLQVELDPALSTVKLTHMSDRSRQANARASSTDTATSFSRNGAAWSEVTSLTSDSCRIRLGGLLRAGWMVGVCNGLAREGVSIDRAHARRLIHDGTWIAELHVLMLPGSSDPLQLPLIEYADHEEVETTGPLRLNDYQLVESSDHGGTLRLTFGAADAVGLLGSLLAAFASLSLLPVEMHIETSDQIARDCLWLASTGAHKPSDTDRRALDALLRRTVQS